MSKVLSSSEFQEHVISKREVALVDFFADWRGHCNTIDPVIDDIGREMKGKVEVYKLDIDQSEDVAINYGVISVPTLMIFKDGKPVDKVVGVQSKDIIMEKLGNYVH